MPTEAPPVPSSAELRERCLELGNQVRELRALPEERRPDSWGQELRTLSDELVETNRVFDAAMAVERYDLERAAWEHAVANPPAPESRGPEAAFNGGGDRRSAGELFTEGLGEGYSGGGFTRDALGDVEVRNLLTGSSDGTSNSHLFAPVGSPHIQQSAIRRMRFFLRDVLPVSPTGLQTVPYIRESNAVTNETGAETVKEASAKPEVAMEFESAEAPIRKIAAWIQMTEEAYMDAPTLRGYVDGRLAYMLLVEEEAQLLSGDGAAPNIEGLTQVTGVQTQSAINDDLGATIGLAIGKVENVDLEATFVAINPITFWTGVVERHSSQMDGGVLSSGNLPFGGPPVTLFGLPAVRTRVMSANGALVGAGMAATIFERAGTTIRSTDSHASLFISNTLVVLAEKRTGLAVHRPDGFVVVTLNFT